MSQWQECHVAATWINQFGGQAKDNITCQRIRRGHHTLAKTCRSGCIVDAGQLGIAALDILHIVFRKAVRIFLSKEFFYGQLVHSLSLRQSSNDQVHRIQRDNRLQVWHLLHVDILPDLVGDKQQFALRMVDDMDRIVGFEVLQYRHDDGAIGHSSQVGGDPVAIVLTHHSNAVILLDTHALKKQVQTGNTLSHLTIGQGHAGAIIGYCLKIPVLTKRVLVYLNKIFFWFCQHIVLFYYLSFFNSPRAMASPIVHPPPVALLVSRQ